MITDAKATGCPKCGGALPKGVLAELCPVCLMEGGAETQTAAGHRKPFEPPSLQELAKVFPQLEMLRLLGAGGMGAVYHAKQRVLGRYVALKILPRGDSEGAGFGERFNREARALARLNHPNIVAVHEFGQAAGLHFFIMEYVDGVNLRQLQQAGRVSPREAMQIIPQICDALQYAHDEGVVHRDIKPENILIDRKGRVKIADFGLAKILDVSPENLRLTVEGQVMGTPHYMAPEQVERPLAVDHRADIYSLGVVFYEMLTGDLPLGKFSPPSSRSRGVQVDVRLDEVVLRALENDPARRYQRASEVKSELKTIEETPRATPEKKPEPEPKPVERHIYWAGIPVVRERDGDREILWEGGVNAVLCGLLLAAGGLYLFGVVTGRPSPNFLGIPSLTVIFIVGAGLRWAMKVPFPADTRVTEEGVLVPRRRFGVSVLALLSITAAVFAFGMLREFGIPAIKRHWGRSGSGPVAQVDRETGAMSATFRQGAKVELLAVSYKDGAPNQWWRPNGWLVTNEVYEVQNPGMASSNTTTNRDIIVRATNLPKDSTGPTYQLLPGGGYTAGGEILRNGQRLNQAWNLRAAIAPDLKTIDMRVGLGLDPWRTIATRDAQSQSSSSLWTPGEPKWDMMFHSVSETAEGAQVTMVMNADHPDWHRRIVAVDTNGVEHSYTTGSGTPAKENAIWTYGFRQLPLAKVKEFRIQVQPIRWVEFRNIRLNPLRPLPPATVAMFGPTRKTGKAFGSL